MDRESRDEYQVVLQAKDMGGHLGGLSGTTTVTVRLSDVNDNPPHFRRSEWRRYQIVAQPLPACVCEGTDWNDLVTECACVRPCVCHSHSATLSFYAPFEALTGAGSDRSAEVARQPHLVVSFDAICF